MIRSVVVGLAVVVGTVVGGLVGLVRCGLVRGRRVLGVVGRRVVVGRSVVVVASVVVVVVVVRRRVVGASVVVGGLVGLVRCGLVRWVVVFGTTSSTTFG